MGAIKQLKREHWEVVLTLLAVLWLVWQGRVFDEADLFRGADNRYWRDVALSVELTPEIEKSGDRLQRIVEKSAELSTNPTGQAAAAETSAWIEKELQAMSVVHDAMAQSFFAPLQVAIRQREEWELRAREGFVGDDRQQAFRPLLEKTLVYRDAYRLRIEGGAAYSRPLECAWGYLSLRAAAHPPLPDNVAPMKALVGMAALLDGESKKLPTEAFSSQPNWRQGIANNDCSGFNSPLEAAQSGAGIIAKARGAAANAAKSSALSALLPKARWQMAAWALAGLLLLSLGRRAVRLNRMLFVSLIVWALLAALTRPHLQWLGGGEWRALSGWMPVVWLTGAAFLALLLPFKQSTPAAFPASALGYSGFVLFAGLSWWLMLDLGANGYFDNRFLGLYQQGYLFIAFVLVSTVPAMRAHFASFGLSVLTILPLLATGTTRRVALCWLFALVFVAGTLLVIPSSHRQLTSEIFRFALIVGLSWFLLARADKLISPWLRPPPNHLPGWRTRLRWEWTHAPIRLKLLAPLLLLLIFVMAGLLKTDDNGPLLVVLFAAAIFIGLGIASWSMKRLPWRVGLGLGMLSVPLYVWAGSFALLRYGQLFGSGSRIAERLENAQNPFLAGNDQMALVLWFQEFAAENGGFGFGYTPWCGDLAASSCGGVPRQIQSDYIYTALVGVYGWWGSGLLLLLLVLWLWRLVRSHPGVTSGQVAANDLGQAWLSWLALCWVGLTLSQLAVTVAGNLAWLPLTGITLPFLSFGSWSLLGNTFFLALALNLNRRAA